MPKICKECLSPVFGKGYCKFHQFLRTDKKPKASKPPKTIRQISKKQAILNREYSKLRETFFSNIENHKCRRVVDECLGLATDIHHDEGRGRALLDVSTWIPLCRVCHSFVETHPKYAKEHGLSSSRLKK